jgi:hypothetical protein
MFHNTNNIILLERSTHHKITELYRQPNEAYGDLRPREWLRGQSWEAQHDFGLEVVSKS